MIKLERFSEPFSRTGNIAADGFRRLLGSPAQDQLQTVLREAIQNSIDASLPGRGPEVLIRLRTLSEEQRDVLRRRIFQEIPEEVERIGLSLSKANLRVLEICDFNTKGLGGPTSGDEAAAGGESLDFVNFMRNVGVARDASHSGGTYGYGKTSLYAASACSTILVDSLTTFRGAATRRFMGCHLGNAFDALVGDGKRKRFTGRHWWGLGDGDNSIDPVSDSGAEELAASLGMPARERGRSGTSIMILDLIEEDAEDARNMEHHIREILLWYFWPRLVRTAPQDRKLGLRLEIEGENMVIPAPENFPPLDRFASAMEDLRNNRGVQVVSSKRPKRELGRLVVSKGLRADRYASSLATASQIPSQACHIALMRPVELVVKYIEGQPYDDRSLEWAGVFICSDDDEIEAAFAMSEPPAHDDWIPDSLPDTRAKYFVRSALRELKKVADQYAAPPMQVSPRDGEKGPSLASTAMQMGRLLDAVSGRGPGRKNHRASRHGGTRLSLSRPEFVRLGLDGTGEKYAVFEAELKNDGKNENLHLNVEAYLVVDGGRTNSEDLPADFMTTILGTSFGECEQWVPGRSLVPVGKASGVIRVWVSVPEEAAVAVRLRFVAGEER